MRVGCCFELGGFVIGFEGRQHHFGLIHKVEDIGRVFVWVRPIEAGQRLYGLNAA